MPQQQLLPLDRHGKEVLKLHIVAHVVVDLRVEPELVLLEQFLDLGAHFEQFFLGIDL